MKHIFLLALIFLLSACAAPVTVAPTATPTVEVTVTSTATIPSPAPESPTAILANPTRLAEQNLTIPGTDGVTLDATDQATWDSAPADAAEKVDEPTVKVWSEAMNQVLYVDKNGEVKAAHDDESGQLLHALLSDNTLWTNEGKTPLVFNPDYPAGKDPQEIAGMVGDYFLQELLARSNGVELGNVLETALETALAKFPNGGTARLKAEQQDFSRAEGILGVPTGTFTKYNYTVAEQKLSINAETPIEVRLVKVPTANMIFSVGATDGEAQVSGMGIEQDENGRVIISYYYEGGGKLQGKMAQVFSRILSRAGYGDDVVIVTKVYNGVHPDETKPLIVFEK